MTKVFNPLISIVIPIYNVENYLKRCIDSVINQTYQNIEIILVDDGSTDHSLLICNSYMDKRIKIIHKENGGLSSARNAGIDIATGHYITFIDSDDYVELNYIEELYNLIKKYNTKISMVDIVRIFESGKKINTSTNKEFIMSQKEFFENMLYARRDLDNSASAKLYDINLFKDVRYPLDRLYEDTATTYKLIFKCENIAVKSVSLYNYMIRSNSIVQNSFNEKKLQIITSVKEMIDAIKNKYPELENACLRKEAWSYLTTLSQLALSDVSDKNLENKLKKFIIENKKQLLKDKKISKKDRFGIICISISFNFYKFCWRLYTKIIYGRK